jgi:hypothetical protein
VETKAADGLICFSTVISGIADSWQWPQSIGQTYPEFSSKANCNMRTALEVPVSRTAKSTIDDVTRARLIATESQQAEFGARIAGLEGVVFALKQQVAELQRQLRDILK